MSQSSMRGTRIGSNSLESERGVNFAERITRNFVCPNGHEMELKFANDAEVPQSWQCRNCSSVAMLTVDGHLTQSESNEEAKTRSHFEMLLERRSREELKEVLQERLEYIRNRRDKGQADL